MKRVFAIIGIIFSFILITGCTTSNTTKKYSVNGINVTMDDDFVEKENVSYTTYLLSDKAMFLALKEDFTTLSQIGIDNNSKLEDYANIIKKTNNLTNEFKKENNFMYTTYEKQINGKNYFYLAAVYKAKDAFWLVNFACVDKDKDKYMPKFIEWTKTVEF